MNSIDVPVFWFFERFSLTYHSAIIFLKFFFAISLLNCGTSTFGIWVLRRSLYLCYVKVSFYLSFLTSNSQRYLWKVIFERFEFINLVSQDFRKPKSFLTLSNLGMTEFLLFKGNLISCFEPYTSSSLSVFLLVFDLNSWSWVP